MLATLIKPRDELITISEDATIEDALALFEEYTSFRAIPILDASGQLFRGAIYKMHIYQYLMNQGDRSLPVTAMMRNMTKFIGINATFFELLFNMRDLPFISILDEDNHFLSIITHSRLMDLFAQSLQTDEGRYTLTLLTDGERGSLEKAAKIISRYTIISSSMTINPDDNPRTVRILFTLPDSVDEGTLSKIIRVLSRKGFHLESLEDLHKQSYL
ncbi:cystathionine beta-synthase [Weissella oryzae SG25]|uniref:Cystathionine beta-synthase n=1 Tax=Weissella oryzae (strain DSM 25784 / JCM 18191 / LMG 30913 / SG25) TaxID=1329250 RepID=A0A069CWF5_WEIOS|nr:cyclic di-AMP binding protein CbpA [Weissella oryzae]GAK31764.1 cystathionine beta-synthase [Weissella oryzae SG25]